MTGVQTCALPISLLQASKQYKPFEYPWAFEFWKRQQQLHWLPEEVPLGEDCRDWAQKLTDHERNLLTQIFRFFTQSDIEVNDNYMERYARVFKPTEIKMMLAAFSNMETIHIAAYALLLETIGMPDTEFGAFMQYKAMADKHSYMKQFGVDTHADIARTLAMFGGFTEGLQLFASFAMLLNFPRQNKMKGMASRTERINAMLADTENPQGTAYAAFHRFDRRTPWLEDFRVGGKTGTAEIKRGGTVVDKTTWFAAFGPDRKSTRLNSSHMSESRMPSSA